MKTKLILFGLFLVLLGCVKKQQDDSVVATVEESEAVSSEPSVVFDATAAIWTYDYNEQTQQLGLKQLRQVDNTTLTGKAIEEIINTSWPKVQVQFIRTSNDTAYVSIPNSTVLTQQMGSMGAESFMVTTTYSFTELKGIRYVSFDFEEGDHARPGVYDRSLGVKE
ncbi:hypothetical protein [Flavobacterium orientale]|uniref:Uncharacterized protein n=1 Tax=Flavobacterium orientale TaxID=1756020 RepID=A0A916Y215_9FLAO|nr:hypothetical protein [Flavobacterium orientale]GGD27610.1 hypothetical protein GCM10011343_17250 [Flavobacterium orientale]